MIKVIKGKRYNTKTAKMVAGNSWRPLMAADIYFELYLTEKGDWFLYAEDDDYETSGGCELIPFTPCEALRWLEKHDCKTEIEHYFNNKKGECDGKCN